MEISEKEYYELKEQIKQLQYKVEGISSPPKDLWSRIIEKPISHVRNIDNNIPVFDYVDRNSSEVWPLFIRMAKLVHAPSDKFYMDKDCYDRPYIRSYRTGETPRKITEMSEEQIQISLDMLNELIPIYNKYFRKTHKTVLYSEKGNGIYENVNVFQTE